MNIMDVWGSVKRYVHRIPILGKITVVGAFFLIVLIMVSS